MDREESRDLLLREDLAREDLAREDSVISETLDGDVLTYLSVESVKRCTKRKREEDEEDEHKGSRARISRDLGDVKVYGNVSMIAGGQLKSAKGLLTRLNKFRNKEGWVVFTFLQDSMTIQMLTKDGIITAVATIPESSMIDGSYVKPDCERLRIVIDATNFMQTLMPVPDGSAVSIYAADNNTVVLVAYNESMTKKRCYTKYGNPTIPEVPSVPTDTCVSVSNVAHFAAACKLPCNSATIKMKLEDNKIFFENGADSNSVTVMNVSCCALTCCDCCRTLADRSSVKWTSSTWRTPLTCSARAAT